MEKINRPPLSDIPTLKKLEDNWEKWGQDNKRWSSSGKLYLEIRTQSEGLTAGHCSFCDDHPIGTNSKETIEHYFPKKDYPCFTFLWDNLFYCCDKCQSEANKSLFEYTLKPDVADYTFNKYFYFDLSTGKLVVLENLKKDNSVAFKLANNFLQRYGINTPKRNQARKDTFNNVKNFFNDSSSADGRVRKHFEYRYIYDFVRRLNGTPEHPVAHNAQDQNSDNTISILAKLSSPIIFWIIIILAVVLLIISFF